MLIYQILLGLFGLGIVVFVHELGHFLAARWMGIGVDAFSIGWGKPILKKKIGDVEYRLGMFPLGGYCKMKGQSDHDPKSQALELDPNANQQENADPQEPAQSAGNGSFYAVHPLRRIVACAAGPVFNLLFAVLVFSVIWGIGLEVTRTDNRIILASEFDPYAVRVAEEAGLQSGDRILSIMGRRTDTFQDIRERIILNPGTTVSGEAERDGQIFQFYITPEMDRSTGAGRIGIVPWEDPVIGRVTPESPAEAASLQSGDRIIRVNGIDLPHTRAFSQIFVDRPEVLEIEFLRNGQILEDVIKPVYMETGIMDLGFSWQVMRYQTPRLSLPRALVTGATETWRTFTMSVRSLSLLFRGVDLTQAVSGPVRITYMVGDVAVSGFNEGFLAGLRALAGFLALISIALAIMNLLPLPVLDGGMILLFLFETVRGKAPPAKFVTVFQTIGIVIIAGLMFFALFGDILYFVQR